MVRPCLKYNNNPNVIDKHKSADWLAICPGSHGEEGGRLRMNWAAIRLYLSSLVPLGVRTT